jgi:hypothetical protein
VLLLDPALLSRGRWLKRAEWTFKKDILYFAGRHFASNRALIDRKHRVLRVMTGLLVIEMTLLAAWLWGQ